MLGFEIWGPCFFLRFGVLKLGVLKFGVLKFWVLKCGVLKFGVLKCGACFMNIWISEHGANP